MAFTRVNTYIERFKTIKSTFEGYIKNNKKLVKNFVTYFSGIFALNGIAFFLIPVYTRELTTANYGQLELINTFINIFSLVIGLGLAQYYIGVEYFHYKGLERKKEIAKVCFIYILIATPVTLLMLLRSNVLNKYLFLSQVPVFLIVLAVIISYLLFFQGGYFTILMQQQKALKLVITQIVVGLVLVGLNLYFIYCLKMGITGIVTAQLIGLLLIILSIFLFNPIKIELDWFKTDIIKEIIPRIKISFPLALTGLASWVMIGADRWILMIYHSVGEVGIYSLACRFGGIFNILILASLSATYSPYIYSRFQEEGILVTEKKNRIFIKYYFIFFMLLTTVGFIVLKPLFFIVVGESFYPSYKYILPVVYGYIFLGLAYFYGYCIYYTKKTNYIFYGYTTGALINIVLNFILIPKYGIWGAALTTTFSYMVMSCYMFFMRRKVLNNLRG
jgi:O-antigen/teichoic acid export membrane protein